MERGYRAGGQPILDPTVRLMAAYRAALGEVEWRAVREIRAHPAVARFYEDPPWKWRCRIIANYRSSLIVDRC